MLTDKDLVKLKKIFVTKKEFQKLTKSHQRLVLEVVRNSDDIEKIREQMVTKEDHNKVMDLVDKVLGEVKAMRQEQAAHNLQHEDTEKRLTKIENIPSVAHELKKRKS